MTTPHDLPPLPDIHWAKLSADEWQMISEWGLAAIAPYKAEVERLRQHIDRRAAGVDPLTQQLRERAEKAEAERDALAIQLKMRPSPMADCPVYCKTAVDLQAKQDKLRELLRELLVAEKLDDDDPRLVSARLAAEATLGEKP